jgi:hypothetical protein
VAVLFHVSYLLSLSYLPREEVINGQIRMEGANVGARAMLGAVVFTTMAIVVPGEVQPFDKGGSIDWFGSYLGIGGLVLFNFVWK